MAFGNEFPGFFPVDQVGVTPADLPLYCWMLTGNALAAPAFFGTTTAIPVDFYTNNIQRMQLSAAGNLLISNGSLITSFNGNSGLNLQSGVGFDLFDTAGNLGFYSNGTLIQTYLGANYFEIAVAESTIYHGTKIKLDSPIYNFATLTADTVPYIDATKNLVSSTITPTELGYLSGAASNIQNQINNLNIGFSWKTAVKVATTADIVLAGEQVIDGILTAGSSVLVKNQAVTTENGVYTSGPGAWTRRADCSTGGSVPSATSILCATVVVEQGAANADQIFTCTSDAPITIGVTAIAFAKTSATTYTGSGGITLTGNDFAITPLGITNGMIANSTIDLTTKVTGILPANNGGTGIANNVASTLTITGAFASTFSVSGAFTYTYPTATSTLLANNLGISGGTTLIGGTGAGENLQLSSTSHATKGLTFIDSVTTGIIFSGPLNSIGIGTVPVANQPFTASQTFAGTYRGVIINPSIAVNASAQFGVQNSAAIFLMEKLSTLFTTSGLVTASQNVLISNTGSMLLATSSGSNLPILFAVGGIGSSNECLRLSGTGIGLSCGAAVKVTVPSAYLHIAAGQAGAGLSLLKFNSGTNLTTAETGAWEYNGTNLSFTRTGTTRESVWCGNSGATAPGTTITPVFTSFYGGNDIALGNPNSWASVVIAGTTYKIPLYT